MLYGSSSIIIRASTALNNCLLSCLAKFLMNLVYQITWEF